MWSGGSITKGDEPAGLAHSGGISGLLTWAYKHALSPGLDGLTGRAGCLCMENNRLLFLGQVLFRDLHEYDRRGDPAAVGRDGFLGSDQLEPVRAGHADANIQGFRHLVQQLQRVLVLAKTTN